MEPPPSLEMGPHGESAPLLLANASSTTEQKVNNNCCGSELDYILPVTTCFIVPERVHYVLLLFGEYIHTITKPGCYVRFVLGLQIRKIRTDLQTFHMENTKIVDSNGSPVIISGIVTYEIVDARRASIDVRNPVAFIKDQAPAILKRVVSQFPYESRDSHVSTLRSSTAVVANRMRDELQKRTIVAGVRIESFNINELAYAPEIAAAMLKRQQAQALIDARREIVKGAKDIAMDAVNTIADDLTPLDRAKLVSNILVVLIGEKEVTPTLQV